MRTITEPVHPSPMRIAVGGIAHETNTFSTVPTAYDDFLRTEGADLIAGPGWDTIRGADVELVPLFAAHAPPSGRVRRKAFDRLLRELIAGLRSALPLDGIVLLLHGAMEVDGLCDGETVVLEAVRRDLGNKIFVSLVLDLHANLAPRVVSMSQIIVAYRTAPHRDAEETRVRAAGLTADCLRNRVRPVSRMVKLPLLVTGEAAVTEVEPAKSLYAGLTDSDNRTGVVVSSILIGCAWTDSPHTGAAAVVSGTDPAVAEAAAKDQAAAIWGARHRFVIDSVCAEPADSIRIARESPVHPVFVSDSGDNTTAGAAGDSTEFLQLLLSDGHDGALVAGITDPAAVAACMEAGAGTGVELTIGGKLDAVFSRPCTCRGLVVKLATDTPVSGEAAELGAQALVRIRNVDVVLQAGRRPFTKLSHFQALGIDPSMYTIIVVKEGYLFPELRDYAPMHVMALTQGFADQRLERLRYRNIKRPIYPLDPCAVYPP